MKVDFAVILFYKFTNIANPKALAALHREKCQELGLKGRVIIAEEGINATLEGRVESIAAYKDFLKTDAANIAAGFDRITVKESDGIGRAFPKLSVKVRDEVVTLGAGRFDVEKETAPEVTAAELQKWYETDEDFVVLDLRNDYEIASGKFERTVDIGLKNFRDLPARIGDLRKELEKIPNIRGKKIVPVCTGGIRCEKATCLLKREGFENLYQLKDGIHTYIAENPGKHFKGTLFVFDNRMTTDVVPVSGKNIIGRCFFCDTATENYCSDDSVRPSRKILCCEKCFEVEGAHLREAVTF
ncbi:MAG: rhodanese-like domain-containing protein [Patescibacteria group bacterium]